MSELRYAEYAWPTEPIAGELTGPLFPDVAEQVKVMHCPSCGLAWAEMPVGHTWRTDGSECWDEPEGDDD